MISTAGGSPPQIAESASSPYCTTSAALMVSTQSPGAHDPDAKRGYINGDSPQSKPRCESRLSVCHMVATPTPKHACSPESESRTEEMVEEGPLASECKVDDSRRSHQSRNKRKNFEPRNIVYHYSEYDSASDGEEYDDDGTEASLPPRKWSSISSYPSYDVEAIEGKGVDNDTSQPLDLSSENSASRSRVRTWSPQSDESHCEAQNPVNLSIRDDRSDVLRNSSTSKPYLEECRQAPFVEPPGAQSGDSPKNFDVRDSRSVAASENPPDSPMGSRPRLHYQDVRGQPETRNLGPVKPSMSDYAENAVKELLGMYGLNEGLDLTSNHTPVTNSGKVLENASSRHSTSHVIGSNHSEADTTTLFHHQQQQPGHLDVLGQSKFDSQALTKESFNHQNSRCLCDPELTSVQPLPDRNEEVVKALRVKMTHSIARMGQLTPNNIAPVQQMMMPQNMATIFTMAALGSKLPPSYPSVESSPTLSTSSTSAEAHICSDTAVVTASCSSPTVVSSGSLNRALGSAQSSYRLDQQQKLAPVDYTRYVKRFSNAAECGNSYCKDLNYREHFHCMDCNSRVFVKKEEMIRHFKWHKKRDDSLQHGFMRYSPMDDCSDRFYNCSHNRKQTHYHCLKESCDKVYISTSDVQMHANYHRKDSAIIQEGFQRFRATENCSTASCLFFGQRTTHFHCRRSGCSFTFKNKADMEKHKSYHIKDEQLNKDGFKKFMKHEHCSFENCRFSRVCNHIHCIRPGCTYVLHSSGQLYSHKRKHERRDTELAYRKFKLAQSMIKTLSEAGGLPQAFVPEAPSSGESSSSPAPGPMQLSALPFSSLQGTNSFLREDTSLSDNYMLSMEKLEQSWNFSNLSESKSPMFPTCVSQASSPTVQAGGGDTSSTPDDTAAVDLSTEQHKNSDDLWRTYLVRYGANELCQPQCEFLYKDHFHCNTDNCSMTFRAKDVLGVKEHACNHEYQEQVTKSFYTVVEPNETGVCPSDCHFKAKEKHYHCKWENCQEIISSDDNPFRRLDHYKIHKYSRKLSAPSEHSPAGSSAASAVENMFRRKRGRPPKNRTAEFAIRPPQLPQTAYAGFTLPKSGDLHHPGLAGSFDPFTSAYNAMPLFPPAADVIGAQTTMSQLIPMSGLSAAMFSSNNIFQVSNQTEKTESIAPPSPSHYTGALHSPDQKQLKPEVQEGFYVYSENVQCPDKLCAFRGQNHFHCMQPRCYYVTDRSDILLLHSKDFHDNIDILDGFVFYDRSVDCRLPGCHSNKVNRHFHCVRSNCNYSFVRYSTMTIHDQKHQQENGSSIISTRKKQAVLVGEDRNSESSAFVKSPVFTENSQPKTTVVKATGTFYPLSAFSTTQSSSCSLTNSHSSSMAVSSDSLLQPQDKRCKDSEREVLISVPCDVDQSFSQNVQQHSPHSNSNFQGTEKHIMYSEQLTCSQTFCKFDKRDHFHCNICSQAVAGFLRLKAHVSKHAGAPSPVPVYPPGHVKMPSPLSGVSEEECGDVSDVEEQPQFSVQNNASAGERSEEISTSIQDNQQVLPSQLLSWQCSGSSSLRTVMKPSFVESTINNVGHLSASSGSFYSLSQVDCSSLIEQVEDSSRSDMKRQFPKSYEDSSEIKKMKIAALRILKDEPIPEGYIRCRFNEDCGYSHCGYREHQTHFHCLRKDCGYSFCDKTRFVQHTARHERLDTLMGGDFQQYRANVNCGRGECMYANTMGTMANKSSHFHCLKCDFVCTDTNKVVAHRRQHAKMDNIYAAGFEKYTPSQSCNVDGCNHNQKQTHYHCLKCQYSVLGLSQMSSHKYRHMEC